MTDQASTSNQNDNDSDSKLNVKDLAKRFEAMSPAKKPVVKRTQTVRATKQKSAKAPVLTVSVTNRPPPPFRRKRSSKKRQISNSVTELRITTGPTDMAIKRKTSSKMKKSKSADANIAAFLTPTALKVEAPKSTTVLPTTKSTQPDRPLPMTATKPKIPPKPMKVTAKPSLEPSSNKVSQMIQQRQEELAKLSLKPKLEPKPVNVPPKSPRQQRPQIPPPSPEVSFLTNSDSGTSTPSLARSANASFKNRRRVVRKPSHRPPAPPVNQKPRFVESTDESNFDEQKSANESFMDTSTRFRHFDESETSGQSETSLESSNKAIRCRLPDGTEVPLLPSIPAPLPPQTFFDDDSNGLYEEIEYEFMMKNNVNPVIPTTGYTPKFNKKSSGRFTPPELYRSSHPDLHRQESGEYADTNEEKIPLGTQTLGRSSAQAIAAALKSEKFFKNSTTDSMTTSVMHNNNNNNNVWLNKTNNKKTASTLDVEKLSQFKNGIQSKMDWLKQKVIVKKTVVSRQRTNSGRQPSVVDSIDSRYYGDDWSSDDDEVDVLEDSDEHYPKDNEDENSRFVSQQKYECIDIRPASTSKNSSSLLEEIESAYQEGRRIKSQTDKESLTEDKNMSQDDSTNLKSTSVNELRPECFQQNKDGARRFSLSQNHLLVDSSLETQSCCSSFQDEEDNDELNIKSFSEEMTTSMITTDDSSENFEQKSLYESQLPIEQPLYQIYMLHEQKLLNDSQLLKPPPVPNPATMDTILNPQDEHESDSVCDSSNDTDDMASISVRRQSSTASTDSGRGADTNSSRVTSTSNSSMRRDRLTAGSAFGSQRSLWCELAEVKEAGLLTNLNEKSRKLQEAYFEVITSEASYLRSLNVLINNFVNAPELQGPKRAVSFITSGERKHLFSNILSIRDCTENLLRDLESRLKESLIVGDVCDILAGHFENKFNPYVLYCSNQVYQDRVLKRLKASNSQFLNVIKRIEQRKELHGLDLRSFLMLPMQRATRYRLLLFAILDHVPNNTPQEFTASRALNLANLLVQNCNEGARLLERTEQLLEIERRLVYKNVELKRIALVRKDRYVVKSGQLTQFVEKRYRPKLNMLHSSQKSRPLYLFLFNDLVLLANKKANGTFNVKDYCYRRYIEIEPLESHSHKIPISVVSSLPSKPHLFMLILMQNARGKQSEYLLNTDSETDRERWLSSIRPPACSNPDEKIYAAWDCPQVLCRHNYSGNQEDELNLQENDLVNVLRKMPDGWYFGERVKDGVQGWFPCSYVQQVMNDHVRANNYRQRLRLIQQAANDLHQQNVRGGQQDKRVSLAAIHAPPFKDRLRRLSNPKAFFTS